MARWACRCSRTRNPLIHAHVVPRYLNQMKHEVGVPNVGRRPGRDRGYDTLGEYDGSGPGAGVVGWLRRRRGERKP